jgi:hypothetical protein
MIQSAQEFIRLRCSKDPQEYGRAAHEEAPEAVWIDIISNHSDMAFWVAHNKTIPETIIRHLFLLDDDRVNDFLARKRRTPHDILFALAQHPHETIRAGVAVNAKTPRWILEVLVHSTLR